MRNLLATQSLFELAHPGRRGCLFPASDVPAQPLEELIPATQLSPQAPSLPELAEPDVIRHFVNLSTLNMSVDTHFYPLGSCTMKYNPKRHERLARLAGIADLHPYQTEHDSQGMLQILYELQQMLGEISGLPAVSLQPAAGGARRIDGAPRGGGLFSRERRGSNTGSLPRQRATGPIPPARLWPASNASSSK